MVRYNLKVQGTVIGLSKREKQLLLDKVKTSVCTEEKNRGLKLKLIDKLEEVE